MFRNPQPKIIKVQEIFRPFISEIWYFICLVLLVGIVILAIVFKFEVADSCVIRLSNSFIVTIGALCQQGIRKLSFSIYILIICLY